MPGANVVNLAVVIGQRLRGAPGAVAAVAGLLVGPSILVIALALAYRSLAGTALVHNALEGTAAAAVGLLIAMGLASARQVAQGNRPIAAAARCTAAAALAILVAVFRPRRSAAPADGADRVVSRAAQHCVDATSPPRRHRWTRPMTDDGRTLAALVFVFVPLSLVSVGGGPAIFAEMQNQAVVVQGWTTEREFADLFAISRAAPGPGVLLVTLIGWNAAGWLGALVASLAFFLPSSLLIYGAARVWNRYRGSRWHAAVEAGFAPIAAGLVFAGAACDPPVGERRPPDLGRRHSGRGGPILAAEPASARTARHRCVRVRSLRPRDMTRGDSCCRRASRRRSSTRLAEVCPSPHRTNQLASGVTMPVMRMPPSMSAPTPVWNWMMVSFPTCTKLISPGVPEKAFCPMKVN